MKYDIVVVGAGAAGLVAAGTAAAAGARVLLLEKMEKPARKVRITGKGRCNITNTKPWQEFSSHVRANSVFFEPSFRAFDNLRTMEFFRKAGVEITTERGSRVFPASGRAWDVADGLVRWCEKQGVKIICKARVTEIINSKGAITGVKFDSGGIPEQASAQCVILCTGGVSYPATGSTGDGYDMAYGLGHGISPLFPSLVSLRSPRRDLQKLQGLMLKNISASLEIDGKSAATEFGEMEFTSARKGGSGPSDTEIAGAVILRLSRDAVEALIAEKEVAIAVDLKPALSVDTLISRIERETAALKPSDRFEALLRKLIPAQLTLVAAHDNGFPLSKPLRDMTREDIIRLASWLKRFRIPISDYAPFEEAVVTAGGVDVAGINPTTMESRKINGLYFAGELLDIDADTGGYNLQIAFSTGYLAGISAADKSKKL